MWLQGVCLLLLYVSASGFGSSPIQDVACVSGSLIKRYQLNEQLYKDCKKDEQDDIALQRFRRRVDTSFKGHPKSRGEVLSTKFHMETYNYDQTTSLVKLVNKIALEYLSKCPPVIYYDSFVEKSDDMILQNLFRTIPMTFYHGEINSRYEAINPRFQEHMDTNCKSYILFLSDPLMARKIIGPQAESRVILIARSTQWKLRDFLASEKSSNIVNLLVVGESLMADPLRERPYVLYTHKLYSDGLGSNVPVVLTSWIKGALSRPHIDLFPNKFRSGFAGHRFQVAASNQPPFIFRIRNINSGGTTEITWEGIEYRLLNMISKKLNFSIDIAEPPRHMGSRSVIDAIQMQIAKKHVDMGMSGVYITEDRIYDTDMSVGHSRDCAAFITLASKALPKYRAIMGPFQWPVWVALTCVYLGAIFPIVYTDRLTLSHLIGNWGEIENMFWYVFGMFTNSLTFSGKYSWSSSQKLSTRLLIGSYWIFTIIITACYTGSIIAFVTLPAFPETIDSVTDLLGLFFRVGTLDNSGWDVWFQNSTHIPTSKLYKKMEFVSTLEEGIGNVTQSFFWNYAFLGSKSQLQYLVQSNFSDENISRRSALHLSEECFALFQVAYIFPRGAVYKQKIDSMIMLAQQSGLVNKISSEVSWTMQRSATGRLLQANSANPLRERMQEERQLTTADTEGMFLLMGVGYLVGAIALFSEIVGGITNKCRQIIKRNRKNSSAWSSKRNSSAGSDDRTPAEQKAHEQRKEQRRKDARAEDVRRQGGFGMREFNLTKATLKEFYANYNTAEPNYVLKDGKLILETNETTLSTGSTEYESRESSAGLSRLARWRNRTNAMVVADVEMAGRQRAATQDSDEEDVRSAMDTLDNCFAQHEGSKETLLEVRHDNSTAGERGLFGSFVEPTAPTEQSMENLQLFDEAAQLRHAKKDKQHPGTDIH